jgi:predicted esterase
MRTGAVVVALASLVFSAVEAAAGGFRLAPYKDELFQYQKIIAEGYGGDFVIVEFLEERDIGGRDEVKLKKAYDKFVSLDVNEAKQDLSIDSEAGTIRYVGVGKTDGGAKMVVIFLHGQHGDRTLAMEDLRFGGNFNRLKNLMNRNGGAYLTPDFTDFGKKGTNQIKALIKHYAANSPGAPIVIGCASTGCKIAFRLIADPEAAGLLGGLVLLGSLPLGSQHEGTIFDIEVFKDRSKQVPIYIGHGSADKTVSWVTQELFFKRIKRAAPDYPIRFELFRSDAAVHGTPLRMMDWRLVLNWMLAANEKKAG